MLISASSYSQIDINLSVCGSNTFTVAGVDGTGRNIYNDGAASFTIQWNNTASQWEVVEIPSTVWFSNTFASTPNPPCFGTGTWVTIDPQCGDIIATTGDCQTSITTGIDENNYKENINVYPNPSFGIFNFEGVLEGNTIEIFNVLGKLITVFDSESDISTIDMSEKNKGVYYFRIKNKTTIVKKGKLVLQ